MAIKAFGTLLKTGVSPTQKTVGEITNIGGLALEADTIETTTMGSADGYREHQQGLKDAGEVSLEGFAEFDDEGQTELLTLFNSGALTDFEIAFPAETGAKWTFKGVVTAIEYEAGLEDNISFSATIKVSGRPTLTVA